MTTTRNMLIWLDKEKRRLEKRLENSDLTIERASLEGSIMTIKKCYSYFSGLNTENKGAETKIKKD